MDMSSEVEESQGESREIDGEPVNIGEILQQRYFIVRKLGWGKFATVWLCLDTQENRSVAMKIVKTKLTSYDEVDILEFMRGSVPFNPYAQRTVKITESFELICEKGAHTCLVMELLGENLYDVLKRAQPRGIPIDNVKSIIRQVLEGLDYLHNWCKIIHTDIKPENVLLCADEQYIRELTREAKELYELECKTMSSVDSKINKPKRVKSRGFNPTLNMVNDSSSDYNVDSLPTDCVSELKEILEKITFHDGIPDVPEMQEGISNEHAFTSDIEADRKKNESSLQNLQYQDAQVSSIRDIDVVKDDPNGELSSKNQLQNITDNINFSITSNFKNSAETNDKTPAKPNDDECLPSRDALPAGIETTRKDPAFEQCKINIKIVDLGSACFENQHITHNIQTPLYRSLEVILCVGYDTSVDIWSTACMAFELATGETLFSPEGCSQWTTYEDHIGQIMELMGPIPHHMIARSKIASPLFTQEGTLINIPELMPMRMDDVLVLKYAWPHEEANVFANFLQKMLELDPAKRLRAADCLKHPWLK